MKEKLLGWAIKKFGEMAIDDLFNLREEITRDKQNNKVNQTILFVKKKKGIKQEWLKADVFNSWIMELKEIIGDNLKLEIFSTEANELRYLGGNIKDEYQEVSGNFYQYQFNLVIWKKY